MRAFRFFPLLLSVVAATMGAGCAADDSGDDETSEDAVKVDTKSPEARAQYDANVRFALGYQPRCTTKGSAKRVLVTGFGRFESIGNNATGRIVSTLVPEAKYPETVQPPHGQVDPPEPQLSVGTTVVDFPNAGKADVCGMVLPVYWDLAAILVSKEIDAFKPDLVIMMGVAGSRQPIWIELGAVNKAVPYDDGSNQLHPAPKSGDSFAPIVSKAANEDQARGNLMAWQRVKDAADAKAKSLAAKVDGSGTRFGDVLSGAALAGFPRQSNTYLCNNVTYVTGYLLDHPGKKVTLLQASTKASGVPNQVDVKLKTDGRAIPRAFVHWPSTLSNEQYPLAAEVLKSLLDAQLTAPAAGPGATSRGTNEIADPDLKGGTFF
jgi:pyrrolidone-carboxylate peptidase